MMNIKSKIYNYIGKVLLVFFGVTCTTWAFVDMFDIPVYMPLIVLFILLLSAAFMLFINLKHKHIIMLCSGIALLFLIILCHKALEKGIFGVANKVIQAYNEYFTGKTIDEFVVVYHKDAFWNTPKQYNTLFICAVLTVYICILVTATYYKVFSSIHILLSAAFLLMGMILGTVPSTICMAFLIFYYLSCVIFRKNKTIYLERMGMLAVMVAVITVVVLLVINPKKYNGEQRFNHYRTAMKKLTGTLGIDTLMNKVDSIFTGGSAQVSSGGINGGRLGQVDRIQYSGEKMFRVVMDRDDNNVYLKGFVGNWYDGISWKQLRSDEQDYGEYAINISSGYEKIISNNYAYIGYHAGDENLKRMEISYLNGSKNYTMYPYYSDLEIPRYVHGLIPDKPEYSVLEYQYYSMDTDEILKLYALNDDTAYQETTFFINKSGNVDFYLSEVFNDRLPEYMTYSDNYLAYDDASYIQDCINRIRKYLAENATYTLNPGKLEADRDYVEDFLFVKKKGYCTAYASAAVQLFRYYGIPARYVEGYVITPNDQKKAKELENGQITVEIKDSSAHAWVEIYVSGVGFVPIEMTPGYYSMKNNPAVNNHQQNQTTEPATEETTDRKEQNSTSEQITESQRTTDHSGRIVTEGGKDKKNDEKIFIVYGILAAVMVVVLVFVIIGRTNRGKRRMRLMDYHTKDMRQNIKILSIYLRKCMDKQKIDYSMNRRMEEIVADMNNLIDRLTELNHEELQCQDTKGSNYDTVENPPELPGRKDTLQVLWIIEKQKYSDKNVEFTQEEMEKVCHYVENLKNSLQYFKNRL